MAVRKIIDKYVKRAGISKQISCHGLRRTCLTNKAARLDNIALVPASLLPLKSTYQPLANRLPTGSVLVVPGTLRQQRIMEKVRSFFRDHGRQVITMPLEKITRTMKKTQRQQAENLLIVF